MFEMKYTLKVILTYISLKRDISFKKKISNTIFLNSIYILFFSFRFQYFKYKIKKYNKNLIINLYFYLIFCLKFIC